MTTIKRTKIIKKMTFNLQIIIIRMTYMISKMKKMKINMKVIKIKMKRNRILSIILNEELKVPLLLPTLTR